MVRTKLPSTREDGMVLISLRRPKQGGQGIQAGLRGLRERTASDMHDKICWLGWLGWLGWDLLGYIG
jgi:hypothetical protein